ncbi:NUDIX hydrolase [Natronomonas sp. EA1]|uniref:NUDIX hydrolase n=1 Tax=Natronomonas sp. EA1 TaxID=3421655 RepID=UPI003EB85D30
MTPEELAARWGGARRVENVHEVTEAEFDPSYADQWGVGAYVEHDGHLLLVRQRDQWLLPGGMLEDGETHAEGAVREVAEETGIPIEITALEAVVTQTFTTGTESFQFHFATFSGVPEHTEVSEDPGIDGETIEEVAWLEEVPENTFEYGLIAALHGE